MLLRGGAQDSSRWQSEASRTVAAFPHWSVGRAVFAVGIQVLPVPDRIITMPLTLKLFGVPLIALMMHRLSPLLIDGC